MIGDAERELENLGWMDYEDALEIFEACKEDEDVCCMLSVNTTVNPWVAEVKLNRR